MFGTHHNHCAAVGAAYEIAAPAGRIELQKRAAACFCSEIARANTQLPQFAI